MIPLRSSSRVVHALAEHAWRGVALRVRSRIAQSLVALPPSTSKLLIAPEEVQSCDPSRASEIYLGCYAFAGVVADTGGRSPFEIVAPSDAWLQALHKFAWLRHLRATESSVARANAQALVDDWIRMSPHLPAIAFEPEVIARRVMAWICQSPMIAEECDVAFYRRFMRSLVRQVRLLSPVVDEMPDGLPRLLGTSVLALAAVSISSYNRQIKARLARLDHEIERQILSDGGHISRNPKAILVALTYLLPLRQALIARGLGPTPVLLGAIERMMPMLRFFQHGNGAFAHFNGMSTTPKDETAAVFTYDDSAGKPISSAGASGYQRLEAGKTLLLMDCGTPPPLTVGQAAHAGTLSFEMSSGRHRIFINCGAPGPTQDRWRPFARATAAHTTLTLNDTSSARFVSGARLERYLGAPIVDGPTNVVVDRSDISAEQPDIAVTALHDGYGRAFGLLHERKLVLATAGGQLSGSDRLISNGRAAAGGEDLCYAIRFHLHPTVKASSARGGKLIHLVLPGGESWAFEVDDGAAELEESIYFADPQGHRRTSQIVINGNFSERPEVNWRVYRVDKPKTRTAQARDVEELPLLDIEPAADPVASASDGGAAPNQ